MSSVGSRGIQCRRNIHILLIQGLLFYAQILHTYLHLLTYDIYPHTNFLYARYACMYIQSIGSTILQIQSWK